MQNRPPNPSNDFGHFKNERLRFLLCVIREIRFAFEAAVASKWLTYLICFPALGGSASWLIKTYWFR